MAHTIQAASEWSIGLGVNGTGRRERIHGFYVLGHYGRRVHAFTGANAEQKAREWAAKCDEMYPERVSPYPKSVA